MSLKPCKYCGEPPQLNTEYGFVQCLTHDCPIEETGFTEDCWQKFNEEGNEDGIYEVLFNPYYWS